MNVTDLLERHASILVGNVRKLYARHRNDMSQYESIRQQVSGDMMLRDWNGVVSYALELLHGEPEWDVLHEIMIHCSEHFHFEDCVLSAVVVPVAVRLKSKKDWEVVISQGDRENLAHLASAMELRQGVKKVIFDSRLYDCDSIYLHSMKDLSEFLLRLEAGEKSPGSDMRCCDIRSEADAKWKMFYFLGVEVSEPGAALRLNDDKTQNALMQSRCHGEWALSELDNLMVNQNVTADVECYGAWYLNRGVLVGESRLRDSQLKAAVAGFDQGVTGVSFYFTNEFREYRHVRLLICNHRMAIEHRWKLQAFETLDGFKKALDEAIDLSVPDRDLNAKQEVTKEEYLDLSRSKNLIR